MSCARPEAAAAMEQYAAQHEAPPLLAKVMHYGEVAIREVRSDRSEPRDLLILPAADAVIASMQLRTFPHHEYWEEGRQAPVSDLRAGQVCLYDLRREIGSRLDKPFHSLHFYLPRAVLDAAARAEGLPLLRDLRYRPGAGSWDPTLQALALAMREALRRPDEASRVFIEHVAMAVASHLVRRYSDAGVAATPRRGGLAEWQLQRAEEYLRAHLDGSASLERLAEELGVSVSHFSRAFKASTGVAPHQWLIEQRVAAAKDLLRSPAQPLAEVALAAGFADQSHFTRTFTRRTGLSPGAWRKQYAVRSGSL